jgi:NAD(P)-dependent dehydrogenase (short-subunit alcohol dehydrogenase family)
MHKGGNETVTRNQTLMAAGLIGGGIAARQIARRKAICFRGKSVLITGGSRGLGLVIARHLAKEGARIALVARDHAELQCASQELCGMGAEVFIVPADVTKREDVDRAVCQTIEHYGALDVLINNAGVMEFGPMENMSPEDFQKAMDTHAWGPLFMMLAAVPHMRKRGSGRIVNISSVGGKVAVPHLAPYAMSKFALTGLSDAMRSELRKDGIYVTSVFPGLMRTGSHVNAEFKGQHEAEFALFSAMAGNPLLSMDADRAACKIVEACRAGRAELVIGVQARLAIIANALFPNITAEIMALAGRLLPRPTTDGSRESRPGKDSTSALSPSVLTRLADKATERNNEGLKEVI